MARAKTADKVYVDGEGNESRHAGPDIQALEFRFPNGHAVKVTLDKVGKNCQKAAMWHGLAQKIGDSYSGKSGDDAIEAAEGMFENMTNDTWVAAKEGGPRVSILAEAIVRAKQEAKQPVKLEDVIEKLKGDEALRKGAMEVPAIAAHHAAIQAERAAERAKTAREAAKGADKAGLGQF